MEPQLQASQINAMVGGGQSQPKMVILETLLVLCCQCRTCDISFCPFFVTLLAVIMTFSSGVHRVPYIILADAFLQHINCG